MWMSILQPEINEHTPKNAKIQPTEKQKNTKVQVRWGPGFSFSFQRGGISHPFPPSVTPLIKSCAFGTRTARSFFAWFRRSNRYDWPNAGRSQRALCMTTVWRHYSNCDTEIHGNSLEVQFNLFLHPDQAQNTSSGIQGWEATAVAAIHCPHKFM